MAENHARDEMTTQRQHEQHLRDTMDSRASAEVKKGDGTATDEKARDGMTSQRQHDKHLQETMAERAEDKNE